MQAVTRDRLSEKDMKIWSRVAITILKQAFEDKQYRNANLNFMSLFLRHAQSAIHYSKDSHEIPEDICSVLLRLGNFLKERGQFDEAKRCFELGLSTIQNIKHIDYNPTKNPLDYDDYVPYKVDPIKLELTRNLGSILMALGDLDGSKKRFREALSDDSMFFGPNHSIVTEDIGNIGLIFYKQGELEDAKRCYERALAIDEKALGPEHTSVAIRVNNLGGVLQAQGDLEGAKRCYERALTIFEKRLGKDHPNAVLVRKNLLSLQEKT